MPTDRDAARRRRFTMEGDPMTVFRIAEAHGFKITHPRWWERTYAIPRWMVWIASAEVTLRALAGIEDIARWLGV